MNLHRLSLALIHWRTWLRLLTLLVAALIIWATLTPHGRLHAKTALFLPSLIPGSPVQPITLFTSTPDRVSVTFSDTDSSWKGDLYLPPTNPPHPAIIVSLGVNPAGRNDERVVSLGEGLARMGIVALIPYSPNLIAKTVTGREVDFTVEAFHFLEQDPRVKPDRIGYLGLCVGSSLALLAAEDPRINERVHFVSWFGGYYNLKDLLVSVATRSYVQDGNRVPWEPDKLTEEVITRRSIQFAGKADWHALESALLHESELSSAQIGDLSPTAKLVHELFRQKDADRAYQILAEMPPSVVELLQQLSPATDIHHIHAQVFVMDDTGDKLIPYVHSRQLVNALPPEKLARHTEFGIFSHVDLDQISNPIRSVPELWSLYFHIRAIFVSIL